jgi:hypothetical protein
MIDTWLWWMESVTNGAAPAWRRSPRGAAHAADGGRRSKKAGRCPTPAYHLASGPDRATGEQEQPMRRSFMKATALLLLGAGWLAAPGQLAAQVTLPQLEAVASRELAASGLKLSGRIVLDAARSRDFAAIDFRGGPGALVIYVHPTPIKQFDLNTWAFVLGHELAHAVTRRANTAQSEQEADVIGARLAIAAGFDLKKYIGFLYTLKGGPETHGTWQERARNLEKHFNVKVGSGYSISAVSSQAASWFERARSLPERPPPPKGKPGPAKRK